jgi:hypothetical protein
MKMKKRDRPMSQTPEPWEVTDGMAIRQKGGVVSIVEVPEAQRDMKGMTENLERITACVNGCAGIPTDSLHKVDVITLLRTLGKLERKVEEGDILIEDAVEAIEQAIEALNQFDK